MNFDEIKNMSKKDFEKFIFKIQSSKQKFCVRCGKFTIDRITISVSKERKIAKKIMQYV